MNTSVLPRSAVLPVRPAARVSFARRLWAALEALGRQRARRELLLQAERYAASRPEVAAALRRAALEG